MSFITNNLSKYAVGSAVTYGMHKLAGDYVYSAAQGALKSGLTFAWSVLKTPAQFAVAGCLIYGGYKVACMLHEHYDPVNRLFDNGFNEKRVEKLQAILPIATLTASALPLAALVITKIC